jgi:hypothetical protein
MRDDQLREQFTQWAEPLRTAQPPALSVIRRRVRRRTARRAGAGGLAVISAVAVAAITLSGFPWAGHAPSPAVTAGGAPSYAVVLNSGPGGQIASVVDMTVGKVVGRVGTAGTLAAGSVIEWVAGAADDRTFVLAARSSLAQTPVDRFYLLELAANGQPGRLTSLDVPPLRGAQIYGMALTADATKLAVAWQNYPNGPVRSHIDVTTLATGATRDWPSASGGALSLSWAGDSTLAFEWQDLTRQARSGLRLLNTSAGTSPLSSRLVVPASTRSGTLSSPGSPLISQDGSALFATMATGAGGNEISIVRFSARTGALQAVLTRPAQSGQSQSQWYCGVLWADPHGRHLVVQCGATQVSISGNHSTRIHLYQPIPASPIGYANTFAW